VSKRIRTHQVLKFKAFVRSQHPAVAMGEIFRKTVEKNESGGSKLKLRRSEFDKLPKEEFSVRDNRSEDRIWKCHRSRQSGQYYLVIDGNDFVINDGSKISLLDEANHCDPEATRYKFEVENN
ncbi:hypothetical protein SLEP1_g60435, partial [Rubroshorea leprosula]